MAVHAFSGTLVATTNSPVTLTSWQPYVVVKVAATPAGDVYVTTDGTVPTVGGADASKVPSGSTAVLKNLGPRPSVGGATVAQTKINLISAVAAVFDVELSSDAGSFVVLA